MSILEGQYVRREAEGLYALRQERYRTFIESGFDHPHDICAVARSRKELQDMCEKHWPDVNYGKVENEA